MENRDIKRSNRDDEFATHYYGNERDLRERDRIARDERRRHEDAETRSSMSKKNPASRPSRSMPSPGSRIAEPGHPAERPEYRGRADEQFRDRVSRDSDVGREPYEPERPYHRLEEDSHYVGESGRRNWRQLYNDFFNDFSVLFKKESALVRTELGEKADLIKQGAVSITTGTIVAFVGIQTLAATIVIALGNVMAWWLAALVTGIALLLIGWAMMATAKRKFSGDNLTPYRSMESFEHMGDMLKEKKDEFTRH